MEWQLKKVQSFCVQAIDINPEYIKQHKPVLYTTLLTKCKLNSYLQDMDVRTTEFYDTLIKQLEKQENITKQLKATDQML